MQINVHLNGSLTCCAVIIEWMVGSGMSSRDKYGQEDGNFYFPETRRVHQRNV